MRVGRVAYRVINVKVYFLFMTKLCRILSLRGRRERLRESERERERKELQLMACVVTSITEREKKVQRTNEQISQPANPQISTE